MVSTATNLLKPQLIQVKLSDVECGSVSLYVGQAGDTSRVEVGEGGARVVVSATTIETEGGVDCKEQGCSSQCRSALLVAACACLPWQLNHPVQAPICLGDLQSSCSSQVRSKRNCFIFQEKKIMLAELIENGSCNTKISILDDFR